MPEVVTREHRILLAVPRQMPNAGVMLRLAPVLFLVGLAGLAHAEPATRLGMTLGLADEGAPGVFQIGPQASLGERLGAFVGEIDYAYLSFFDPDASPTGVHRIGVTLRSDILRTDNSLCTLSYACTRARSMYAEIGGAERFGRWQLDATHVVPSHSPVPEAHVGIGIELDNRLYPYRYGWQVGLRLSVAPRDAESVMASCRGCSATQMQTTMAQGGIDKALLLEWMFLFGR